MRALAWDDKPEDYLNGLIVHLETYGIQTESAKDFQAVPAMIANGRWDFLITDILDESNTAKAEGISRGAWLAKMGLDRGLPVYVITSHPQHPSIETMDGDIRVFSKGTPESFVAWDIRRDLKRRGVPDPRKVFLIYGHDHLASGVTRKVEAELKEWGLKVTRGGQAMSSELVRHLLDEMKDSAAIIAICTPDDEVKPSDGQPLYRQPRQNVLLEIGMAMGIQFGLKKLTFMRRWDDADPLKRASLPSDLGGVITINFGSSQEKALIELKERLLRMGVECN